MSRESPSDGDLRAQAASIFMAGVERADPLRLIERCLSLDGERLIVRSGTVEKSWYLSAYRRILLVGFGKASARMALGIERLLGNRITSGLVVTKSGQLEMLSRVRLLEAAHPVPDERSEEAARLMLELAEGAGKDCLVLNCVSGGGSALLCAPAFGLGLDEKRELCSLLLASGAPIGDVNCVRKHLSLVKGGRLARAFHPAEVVNLILSDVMGDDLATIASGPTVPDPTTWAEAFAILERYALLDKLSSSLRRVFEEGAAGRLPETPKPGDPSFASSSNILIGSNYLSLLAAREKAESLGFAPLILSTRLEAESRELGRVFEDIAADIRARSLPLAPPACVIAGGESTVTLRGRGKGGRNQEMALSFLDAAMDASLDLSGIAFLSGATDGSDGPTDAAGGLIDRSTLEACSAAGLDAKAALAENGSYFFLKAAGALFSTGPTNTNVCDIQVVLVR